MPYITKEKILLRDLSDHQPEYINVLFVGLDSTLAALYESFFTAHNMRGYRSEKFENAGASINFFSPHVLVGGVNAESHFSTNLRHLNNIREQFPVLPIVTVGFVLQQEQLNKLMGLGVVSHINRSLTRPQDVVYIIKTLINR